MTTPNELPVKSAALRAKFHVGHSMWTEIRADIGCTGHMMFESDVIKSMRKLYGTRRNKQVGKLRKHSVK